MEHLTLPELCSEVTFLHTMEDTQNERCKRREQIQRFSGMALELEFRGCAALRSGTSGHCWMHLAKLGPKLDSVRPRLAANARIRSNSGSCPTATRPLGPRQTMRLRPRAAWWRRTSEEEHAPLRLIVHVDPRRGAIATLSLDGEASRTPTLRVISRVVEQLRVFADLPRCMAQVASTLLCLRSAFGYVLLICGSGAASDPWKPFGRRSCRAWAPLERRSGVRMPFGRWSGAARTPLEDAPRNDPDRENDQSGERS